MPRLLADMVQGLELVAVRGDLHREIRGISHDSRKVRSGDLFICIPGFRLDGHQFARDAVRAGATAILAEHDLTGLTVPVVQAKDVRQAMALVAARFYDCPSLSLRLFGITGTNGKTTTSYWLRSIFESSGHATGLIGTLAYYVGNRQIPAPNTTPESPDLQQLLAQMREAGVSHAVMEVSSHGIALQRIAGTAFDVGVFTNLTRDHLDFHRTFESYLETKRSFFIDLDRSPKAGKYIVVNRDDPSCPRLLQGVNSEAVFYGMDARSHVYPLEFDLGLDRSRVRIRTPTGELQATLRILGRTNLYNALAASAVAWREGVSPEQIQQGLEGLAGVPGRFERIDSGRGFSVIVDYAHTPDGLERLLRSVRELTPGRVVAVFGCGGNRDQGKRPQMGAISTRHADHTILTSDNPRFEDPLEIIKEIAEGISGGSHESVPDRREAIQKALAMAVPGDAVVIAGKGHEDYQILGERKIHFDDREVVKELLGIAEEARGVPGGPRS